MEQEDIPRNPFHDTSITASNTMNQEDVLHLQSINDIVTDIKTHDTEFVSLDINEIQSQSQTKGNISSQSKEEELKQKEIELNASRNGSGGDVSTNPPTENQSTNDKKPNWPHASFAYLFHDIESEIPDGMKKLVYTGYKTWQLTAIGYVTNLIAITCAAFHDNYYDSGLQKSEAVFTSLLWLGITTPIGFLLWYMNLYRISKKFKTKNWLIFMVTFIIHVLFATIILSGCPWYPCAGVFFTMTCFFTGSIVSGIFGLMNSTLWFVIIILSLSIYRQAEFIKPNQTSNNNINEAKKDFKSTVASIAAMAV